MVKPNSALHIRGYQMDWLRFLPLAGRALAIVIEIGAGALLILGLNAKAAALPLALFCVATAVLFHHNFADRNQMVHFFLTL